ncbi:MAG: protein kinase [Candidatus Solibacter usitatus]|nr:protein kinase [Candidatus Solibacter usitatus]
MTIGPGTTLGPYEILSLLGEGGMGSVWKARDPRLGRFVAIKVARVQFSERFDREARAVAALNHNNICTLYDIGPNYLVMEFIEGPTLGARIQQSPMTLNEATPILRQLVDGIEAAHEKNIYHRDLKPDNIKITPEGVVKILDFGLAKAADPPPMPDDPANAPTLRIMTVAGMIMGTPSYMSPEQAAGKPVDKRADIWAFGVIVWEMLTKTQLFGGETIAHTLAEVLTKELNLDGTPQSIRPLLTRCLIREAKERMRDIGEARIALNKIAAGEQEAISAPPVLARGRRLFPALAAIFALLAVGAAIYSWFATRPVKQQFVTLDTNLGAPAPMDTLWATLGISPDGSRIAFVANVKGGRMLFSRRLDQESATVIPGTEDAAYPFFSLDGRWIGFFDTGSLKKVSVDGGTPITLCEAAAGRGASWGEDGNIIASLGNAQGLTLIPAAGGKPSALTQLDKTESTHRFPSVLPGGRGVLFFASQSGNYNVGNIEVFSFKDRKRRVLVNGTYPRYLASGHLVYLKSSTLFALPFDIGSMTVKGSPFPLVDHVAVREGRGHGLYDVSRNGTLIFYRSSSLDGGGDTLKWLEAAGRGADIPGITGVLSQRLAPDGKKVAYVSLQNSRATLLVYDLQRASKTTLTFEHSVSDFAWTPDSRGIFFSAGGLLFWTRADGASQPQKILEEKEPLFLHDISQDGQLLSFGKSRTAIYNAKLEYDGKPSGETAPRVGKLEQCCRDGRVMFGSRISPDGKWIAFHSIEASAPQVYVRSIPDSGAKWHVSVDGGASPVWSPNGRELFYKLQSGRIMVVEYTSKGGVFSPGIPRSWSEQRVSGGATIANMSLTPDGKRMLVMAARAGQESEASPQATIIFNLFEEVRRRAQASGQ